MLARKVSVKFEVRPLATKAPENGTGLARDFVQCVGASARYQIVAIGQFVDRVNMARKVS